jgi:hypothetical protein
MNKMQYLSRTTTESIKWAGILIVPSAVLLFVLIGVAGSIEGGGKLLFLIAVGPLLLIEPAFSGSDGAATWVAVVVAECVYFFVAVLLFRLLQLHRLCRFVGKRLVKVFRPKTPN